MANRLSGRLNVERLVLRCYALLALLIFAMFIVLPLATLLIRSAQSPNGQWLGFAQFSHYLAIAHVQTAIQNSLTLGAISALVTTFLAFVYAYALTMSCMRFKPFFKSMALIPLLSPSLLMAISLIYLFGNQGLLKSWLGNASIYGGLGIVVGSVLWTLPHALLLLTSTLSNQDARLIEAARTLGASQWRVFYTVTLPACRHSLLITFMAVFVLVITDFGVPKVVGGQTNMLATELYKQVVGQQNFSMGAVVGVLLLLPAVAAFVMESYLKRSQASALGTKTTVHQPSARPVLDFVLGLFCTVVALGLIGMVGTALLAAVANFWPYDLSLTLKHFDFDTADGGGWQSYWNALRLAFLTACLGTVTAFLSAWFVEKPSPTLGGIGLNFARKAVHMVANLPMAVPGLALGVAYILFFNAKDNPLNGWYATLSILVVCTVVHFFSVAHLALIAALKQLDKEFELVATSLGVPFWSTLWRVYIPVCLPTLLEVFGFFFINALTTVSAVVFLYAPHTQLASVAVLNMDDAGDTAQAAAMAILIFITAAIAKGFIHWCSQTVLKRTQRWRFSQTEQ